MSHNEHGDAGKRAIVKLTWELAEAADQLINQLDQRLIDNTPARVPSGDVAGFMAALDAVARCRPVAQLRAASEGIKRLLDVERPTWRAELAAWRDQVRRAGGGV